MSNGKVIFVTNLYPSCKRPYKGSFVKNLYDGFSETGLFVDLVDLKYFGESSFFKVFAYLYFYMRAFLKAVFSNSNDIIYIHYASHSSLGILLAGMIRKLNIVTNVHGGDVFSEVSDGRKLSQLKIFISRKILLKSKYIISPSLYFKSLVHENYGIPLELIFVSPSGGVSEKVFNNVGITSSSKDVVFGYVGRIEKDKGVFDLIEAFLDVRLGSPLIKLVIIGSGSAEGEVKRIVENEPSITILAGVAQAELCNIYRGLSFLVFPSYHESLGLVPIEAMMCGIPVIASKIGATSEYIRSDLAQFYFSPSNKNELITSLNLALSIDSVKYDKLVSLSICIASKYESQQVIRNLTLLFKKIFKDIS
jgi:glycosyltransferase involved in cell wall biosynthesis